MSTDYDLEIIGAGAATFAGAPTGKNKSNEGGEK